MSSSTRPARPLRTQVRGAADRGQRERLNDELKALNDWLETQPPAIADVVRGVAIDVINNDVIVRAENVAGVELPDFLSGVRVLFAPTELTPQPAADLHPVAGNAAPDALLGGDAYASLGQGTGLRCSLGFNAEDRRGPVNITAGHCDPNRAQAGTQWASDVYQLNGETLGQHLGKFEKTSLDDSDYAIIRPTGEAEGRFENNGVRVPGAAPLPITGTADPIVGTPVCKSGLRTGYSCGVVTAASQNVEIGHRILQNGFSTNCARSRATVAARSSPAPCHGHLERLERRPIRHVRDRHSRQRPAG